MVVRINTGKDIVGILRYNELKRETGKAQLISCNGFLPGVEKLSSFQLGKRFKELTDLNRRTKTNAVHISLNFAPGDRIDSVKMKEIAHAYLEKIGFGGQPCLIYEHKDTGHPHLHIVTVNVDSKGKRIETHNLGKNQSEIARKELELAFNLVPAEKQSYTGPDLTTLGQISYGEGPSKASLNAVLNHVWRNYQFSSFGEYNAVLKAFKVEAYRGESDTLRFLRGGLVYHILDESGKRMGVPLKASSFYFKPTLKHLEKRYPIGKKAKSNLLPQVQNKIEGIHLKQNFGSLEEFEKGLRRQGISLYLNYARNGRIFGVCYVDHSLRIAVKGSDLGKEHGAMALSERFNLSPITNDSKLLEDQEGGKIPDQLCSLHLPNPISNPSFFLSANSPVPEFSDSPYQGPIVKPKKKKKRKSSNSSET